MIGVLWSTGLEYESSWTTGVPATFVFGDIFPGFDQGVEGMKVGGRRRIVIPPDLGYGAEGDAPLVPPNETLVLVIDLLDVKPAGGSAADTTEWCEEGYDG